MTDLKKLFYPQKIAVIGASRNPKKIGHLVFNNLLESDFRGKCYPVNPKAKTILDQPAFASILDLPQTADLAIIVVPANIVPTVLAEVGQSGTKTAIIISAGFAEAGPQGKEKQEQLSAIVQKYNLKVLGPNCLGIINPLINLNASWGEIIPKSGNIAFISQSGALATPIIELLNESGLGLSYFASLGNKADIDETDLLEFFGQDKKTNLIIAYLESFKNGQRLINLAQKITLKKPIIILKAGQTRLGAQSAQSHTASLATPEKVTEGIFNQSNIIAAANINELINLTKLLSQRKPNTIGKRTAIITNAGGPGVLTTDAIVKNNLSLAKISPETKACLAQILPQEASLDNPIDILGNADEESYFKTSKNILADRGVDNLIVILTKQRGTPIKEIAQKISQIKTKKIIIPIFMGGNSIKPAKQIFQKNNLINFTCPQQAIASLAKIIAYQKRIKIKSRSVKTKINHRKIRKLLDKKSEGWLNESEGLKILSACQINTPRFFSFNKKTQGRKFLKKINYPVFLKVLSTKIIHKTEQGAVQKINSDNDFDTQFNRMNKNFPEHDFILAEAVEGEIELIIGIKEDPVFGHLIMVGAGGIYTEILKDTAFRALPVNNNDVSSMLSELKIYPILEGARGKRKINLEQVEKIILTIAELVSQFPRINQLDINPLIAGSKAVAVDIKISLTGNCSS